MTGTPFASTMPIEVTVLELRNDASTVRRMAGDLMQAWQEFPLGLDGLVHQCFRHDPPLPIEIEHAIELTEEAVMPLADKFAGPPRIILQGAGGFLIANALNAGGVLQVVLTLDEVESLFNRLTAVSLGRPSNQESLPTNGRFAASLLILREFMHHLHFAEVAL